MNPGQRPWHQDEEPQINMTPMLDVVFILLIFFIVSASFTQLSQVGIEPASASQASAVTDAPVVITLDAAGQVLLDNQRLDPYYLPARLAQLKAQNPRLRLLLLADRDCPTGVTIEVLDASRKAGIDDSAVLVNTP
ncbi:biopolymer transporter ExbD [Ferrimonas balearica]|uniref:ExbD/TolR family protein n=1 Tax=Ferrimonas balearica TaxID=44012 RepID=UPI001C560A65|nr:biopolymer transporter ExbD [Ferrimonas balearica]MBW3138115.1 biopolymer transporter ExbD [Ferrimonas balearica]